MTTLREVLDSIFDGRYELYSILQSGLGNINAIAEAIRPECKRMLGRDISRAALGMALRRYLQKSSPASRRHVRFPKHIEITTRSSMYEVALSRTPRTLKLTDTIRRNPVMSASGYLSIMEGAYEIVILTGMKYKSSVKRIIGKTPITSEVNNIAAVTVNWPHVTKDTPGIYARVTRTLARREISIQSFHTIGAEMSIFVKENMLGDAYQVLSRFLNNELFE